MNAPALRTNIGQAAAPLAVQQPTPVGVLGGVLACGVLAIGCGDDGGSAAPDSAVAADADAGADAANDATIGTVFPVSGDVVGPAPATGIVVAAWVVSSGSPDYVYKFGEGTSTDVHYMISFTGEPPPAALNSYGVGVGILAILAPGTVLPADGIVSDTVFNGAKFSTDYGIIFKSPTATSPAALDADVPHGLRVRALRARGHRVR